MTEDKEWIVRAKSGDEQAFSELVERYQQPIFNLCYRMLHNREDADDAAQETFLRAYRSMARYDTQRSLLTWLLSIAAHHCIDRLRRSQFQWVSLQALIGRSSSMEGPEATVERRQQAEQIERALMGLRSIDRAVVILRYWNELSVAAIAETLGLTPSAVKSRLHRARRQLAEDFRSRSEAARGEPSEVHRRGSKRNSEAVRI